MAVKVLTANYHRNGVAGNGFSVAIVKGVFKRGDGPWLYIEHAGDVGSYSLLAVADIANHDLEPRWRGDDAAHVCSKAVDSAIQERYKA